MTTSSEPLRFLLDTNAFIALEPFAGSIEPGMSTAATFVRLAARQNHRIFVHPASRDELSEGADQLRIAQSVAELSKFDMLDESPISTALRAAAGDSVPGTNNHRDLRLLAAVHSNAVHYLVSDDSRLRKRAVRAGIGDRILTRADAAALLAGLEPASTSPPPRVVLVKAYSLDLEQAIFDSLRSDYADFDKWISKVQADSDNRLCFVVVEADGTYSGIAIVKCAEADCEYDLPATVSKISTFKVSPDRAGNRYGELLLKAILGAHANDAVASTYVEVLPVHVILIDFLEQFGFEDLGVTTARGERVLAKRYVIADDAISLDPLDYHVRFGPPAVAPDSRVFVVPIQPRWHDQLFPDDVAPAGIGDQLPFDTMSTMTHPWGNALRKAYLCHASTNQLHPGDVLVFYRSHDRKSASVVGVLEDASRMSSPDAVLSRVAGRTVYTRSDVVSLCDHPSEVLVLMFRQDRLISPAWTYAELIASGVLNGPPRTVVQVKGEGTKWVLSQLNAQP